MQVATQLPVNLAAILSTLVCSTCGQSLSRNDLCNLASPADLVKVLLPMLVINYRRPSCSLPCVTSGQKKFCIQVDGMTCAAALREGSLQARRLKDGLQVVYSPNPSYMSMLHLSLNCTLPHACLLWMRRTEYQNMLPLAGAAFRGRTTQVPLLRRGARDAHGGWYCSRHKCRCHPVSSQVCRILLLAFL